MTLPSALLTNWILANIDTGEELEGDFEAQNVTREISASYVEHHTLSRQNPIQQFLHGNSQTLSFEGRFFVDPAVFSLTGLPFSGVSLLPIKGPENRFTLRPSEKMAKLEEWASVNPNLQRPPILQFAIGNGELSQISFIDSISGIQYDRPLITGEIRGITFTLNLRKFVPFDIEIAALPPPESRYHHVKDGDYYELVAQREYGVPLLGDVVRKRHPDKTVVTDGDVVKLPSLRAIQNVRVVPTSIAMQNLTSKQPSPQSTLRQFFLDKLNREQYSTIVPEGV